MDRFERCVAFVIALEGGDRIVDDPADPGGVTRWGISQRAHPEVDVRTLSREQAQEIYRRSYWEPMRCDELPPPIDMAAFDAAVNQGRVAAARMLQQALGVAVDGIVGPQTIAAARAADRWQAARFMALRALRYTRTANFDRYGAGWLTRLFLVAMHG
jgi:lysozyme family protein